MPALDTFSPSRSYAVEVLEDRDIVLRAPLAGSENMHTRSGRREPGVLVWTGLFMKRCWPGLFLLFGDVDVV